MRPYLRSALHHLAKTRADDIGMASALAAALAGAVALIARLARLSRDVDAHAREVAKLWAETDDVRTKLFSIGEDFVDALSSPPPPVGDQR